MAVCRNKLAETTGPGESAYTQLPVGPMGDVVTRYHISLDVADKPGVLAQVATVFAEHGVSIDTVRQQSKAGPPAAGETAEPGRGVPRRRHAPGGRRRPVVDRRRAARTGHRPGRRQHHAGRRGVKEPMSAISTASRQWRGIIEEYRDRLQVGVDRGRHAA
ncbi:hypothetical protein SRIMM317S_03943 [Streptomyces rimosus subsp. rimosus]